MGLEPGMTFNVEIVLSCPVSSEQKAEEDWARYKYPSHNTRGAGRLLTDSGEMSEHSSATGRLCWGEGKLKGRFLLATS